MKKIDMHVHSKYSEHPSDWYLQRLGAQESYTEPDQIYNIAKQKGMDYVTITDHNRIDGALLLKEKHPEDVIVGVEATTYFPEDGCKIHVLLYDITIEQFNNIQNKRADIYDLREYIKENNIAHSVAHATYSINGKISVTHLERLIVLFDVFEIINGARLRLFNQQWKQVLENLTPAHIKKLSEKYHIKPMTEDSWKKGFTGGSDDHAGIFIANTYTEIKAENIKEYITHFKTKNSRAQGTHNTYKYLAFAIFKIALDFGRTKNEKISNSLLSRIGEKIFSSEKLSLKERFQLNRLRSNYQKNGFTVERLALEIVDEVKHIEQKHIKKRLDVVFEKLSDMSDAFFGKIFESLEKDITNGNLLNLVMSVTSSLPGLFLTFPFLSTMNHLYKNRHLIRELESSLKIKLPTQEKQILWFTDTFTDLNGVSVSLQEMAWQASKNKLPIKIVTQLKNDNDTSSIPPNVISLPTFHSINLPYYETYEIKFPSILKSIDLLYREEPTEIVISTPGPTGLLGILISRILDIPCTGIYHTDFSMEIEEIAGDNSLTDLVESYIKWFYSMMDFIKTPSREYINILKNRGIDEKKIDVLDKAIDLELFQPNGYQRRDICRLYQIQDGINLLYAGRISKDKNMDFLSAVYKKLCQTDRDINLLIAGDGPYKDELQAALKDMERIHFLGKLSRHELIKFYATSDLFLFPSTTDTFGMVVMEAQACGLPAIVSDTGGPKEVIYPEKSGYIAKSNDLDDWLDKTKKLIKLRREGNGAYSAMKDAARKNVRKKYQWNNFFKKVGVE
ncbi:glycosyltransferase [candidate division KSB1 bacterium]|nr:glycosyltransferase [candidate division KSB1 bacterium]